MEALLIGVVVLVAVVLIYRHKHTSKPKPVVVQKLPNQQQSEPQSNDAHGLKINSKVEVTFGFSSADEKKRKPLQPVGDMTWRINPECQIPITLGACGKDVAEQVKVFLDQHEYVGWHEVKPLTDILIRTNLRWLELDEWVKKWKPVYEHAMKQYGLEDPEWALASELDKADLMAEYHEKALEAVTVRPSRYDIRVLLYDEPEDATFDDELVERFSSEILSVYVDYFARNKGAFIIDAETWSRETFEKMVSAGLAIRGKDIPPELALEALRVVDLNEIGKDLGMKKFTRKAMAIDALKGVEGVHDRIAKFISLRSAFALKPLPPEFSHVNLPELAKSWRYQGDIAQMLHQTYRNSYRDFDHDSDTLDRDYIRGWRVWGLDDACMACKTLAEVKYAKNKRPHAPFHVGCNCHIDPDLKT